MNLAYDFIIISLNYFIIFYLNSNIEYISYANLAMTLLSYYSNFFSYLYLRLFKVFFL